MKMKRFGFFSASLIIGLSSIFFLSNSCKHDGIPATDMAPVPFTQVQLIYSSYCGKCHGGGKGGESRLDLTGYTGIRNSVVPFNSSKSKSYQSMISTIQIMPPDVALPTNERILVRLWIDQGANP
jgi:hypothetical protein